MDTSGRTTKSVSIPRDELLSVVERRVQTLRHRAAGEPSQEIQRAVHAGCAELILLSIHFGVVPSPESTGFTAAAIAELIAFYASMQGHQIYP